jgi:P-type conjugative transfer protein TrbJ
MRRSLTAFVLAVMLAVQYPRPLQAGAFATEFTQILNHGQLVMQYIRQGEQLREAILQYEDMLRNVKNLPSQTFGPIIADIKQLAAIVQGGMALAYSMASLDSEFRRRYPGYAASTGTYFTNYRTWAQTSLDTTLGTLRAAGLQGQQLQSEQAVLSNLRSMAQSSDGRMQALQVLGDIAEQQVQQLMKLRQLMLADLQSKQAYQATQIQKQAAIEAASEQFLNSNPSTGDGKTYQAGWK